MRPDTNETIRYWKDLEFRETSSGAPAANPAGTLEVDDALLGEVSGSFSTEGLLTWGCCYGASWHVLCDLDTKGFSSYGCCVMEA